MEGTNRNQENSKVSPNRSSKQRKLCFRELLSKVEELEEKEDLGLQTANDVGCILEEINSLERECCIDKRVEQTDETLLDCMVLSSASSILVKCIESVDVSRATYEFTEFTNKLKQQITDDKEEEFRTSSLLKLLEDARLVIPEVPLYRFMYGAYDLAAIPVEKIKKTVTKNPKEKFTKKEPERVVNADKEEEGIDGIVKNMYKILLEEYVNNDECPIKYYDYVIDTEDFSSTIENMFYCSFLVRDGKAKIDLVNNRPIITPIKKGELKKFRDEGGSNAQIITTITLDDWERHKKEGFLQQRKKLKEK